MGYRVTWEQMRPSPDGYDRHLRGIFGIFYFFVLQKLFAAFWLLVLFQHLLRKAAFDRRDTYGKTILLAVDGSSGAHNAIDYMLGTVEPTHAAVILAYVIEWSPYSFNTPEENAERHQRREKQKFRVPMIR